MSKAEHPFRARLAAIEGVTPRRVLPRALYLPAVLNGVGFTREFDHPTYKTIGAGEFSQATPGGSDLLRPDDIETLTVFWNPRWLVDPDRALPWRGQASVRQRLFRLADSKQPFELVISRKGLLPNTMAPGLSVMRANFKIVSLRTENQKGWWDAEFYTLGIEEWRSASVERMGSQRPIEEGAHRLARGDTLVSIAREHYDSAGAWSAVARANGVRKWGQNTPLVQHKRFRVGSKILLPAIPRTSPTGFPRAPRNALARGR